MAARAALLLLASAQAALVVGEGALDGGGIPRGPPQWREFLLAVAAVTQLAAQLPLPLLLAQRRSCKCGLPVFYCWALPAAPCGLALFR